MRVGTVISAAVVALLAGGMWWGAVMIDRAGRDRNIRLLREGGCFHCGARWKGYRMCTSYGVVLYWGRRCFSIGLRMLAVGWLILAAFLL